MSDSMRSLYSFGVAGLLKEECVVYYCNNLQSKSLGRVSDLLCAQIKDFRTDELKLRALLLFSFFETKNINKTEENDDHKVFSSVNLEVGIDGTYTAVGVSFNWENFDANFSGIIDRIKNKQLNNSFELLLYYLCEMSTQVVLKYEQSQKRIEIVSILHRGQPDKKDPIEVVVVDSTKSMLIEAKQYIEIGDLNYNLLLSESSQTVKTPSEENGDITEVLGSEKNNNQSTTILAANFAGHEATQANLENQVSELHNRIKKLNEENERLKNQGLTKQFNTDSHISDDEKIVLKATQAQADESPVMNFLKNIWPFKAEESVQTTGDSVTVLKATAQVPQNMLDTIVVSDSQTPKDSSEQNITAAQPTAASTADEQKLNEVAIPKDAERSLNELKKIAQANELSKAEVLQEKARLADLHKELNKQMRQREIDFKNKERTLNTELRKKEDELRQKNTFISRQKEQIAALNSALELAKTASGRTEDAQSKLKIDTLQKLAHMKEEDNKKLNLKVKDLENRLIIAQSKSTNKPVQDNQANAKLQNMEKKLEEYKRLNQRLTETLNSARDRGNDRESQDLKRKIEILERQTNESKKNLEKTQFRLKEIQDSEKKLQLDLTRAIDENKKLRQTMNKNGSDGGNKAA